MSSKTHFVFILEVLSRRKQSYPSLCLFWRFFPAESNRTHPCVYFGGSFPQKAILPILDPDTGLWNCSVPHWPQFQTHLACNLWVQCQGGEDEDGCHYTRCHSSGFSVDGKCYILGSERTSTLIGAETSCGSVGGRLASMKSQAEIEKVIAVLWKNIIISFHVGFLSDIPGLPIL